MNMAIVLFIDDDPEILEAYIEAVAALPNVRPVYVQTVDEALAYLRVPGNPADVIVWDMMMPAGEAFAGRDTEGGLLTGRLLFPMMRELRPQAKFILLTLMGNVLQEYHLPEDKSYACSKLRTSPHGLAGLVAKLIR